MWEEIKGREIKMLEDCIFSDNEWKDIISHARVSFSLIDDEELYHLGQAVTRLRERSIAQ